MDPKHDPAFMEILREEKNIAGFLDSFFGFLYRCTDFYVEAPPDQRIGFPPGVAEQLVLTSLRKWKNIKNLSEFSPTKAEAVPPAIEEVTVGGDGTIEEAKAKPQSSGPSVSDCYNGASYDNYRWSQSIGELDVVVRLPEEARTSKDVLVRLSAEEIEVAVKSSEDGAEAWKTLLKGRFSFKIKSSESYWCLEPGKHTSLHLEKASERWWESLVDGEPRIELSKIDCSRNLEEMAECEQMKVEELMWNQRRKLLGQPTSDQIRMEKIMQLAWNADGSPFKGTEYDPSILKFN
ncbi:nudC domain-containing protein 3 isoform X2 [Nasonia vitripennis]|uniref:CS domain-containing protein n=1 Tax=Nasonia vitripennis TaxID=7425 RepID=A0A7M7H7F6_NASVI|nr:nudC domain-containing protein 3 isoform X2 [Nasonia vitripennis]